MSTTFSNNDADDEFGYSVALDNDTLAVGAYYEDINHTTTTKVIVIDGSDSTFSEGIDETDTVEVSSAFAVLELLVLLLLLDLLHIVSTKPRIATKNTCHSLSFHMIPPKLRLINT